MTVKNLDPTSPEATHPAKTFEPSHYLMQIDGRDYLEVKWRLVWLRAEYPTARVSTRLVKHEDGFALFRAQVTLPTGASATGWGSETSQDFADYIEAAETKALGRALAALGFGTQFTRDYDFAEAAAATAPRQQVVDAPVGPPQSVTSARTLNAVPATNPNGNGTSAPARPAANGNSLTEKQLKAIYAIGRAAQHLSEDEVDARCQAAFGCRPEELSRLEASQFIDMLKGVQAA
jgi:hypothetical protein